jgi:hypothetical protein
MKQLHQHQWQPKHSSADFTDITPTQLPPMRKALDFEYVSAQDERNLTTGLR